ncbi:unnamed protein product [Orchesella dallaii]|uniref:EF-hand domain-containing protein n=1 Tax=Orchesella dallaii TaxID=48710 RepID=A0ABP1S0Z7_9HEXA
MMKFCIFVLFLFVAISKISSQCCRINLLTNLCQDGVKGTPCCGVKSCNIFCCNCSDEGCRVGDHSVWRHYWNKAVSYVRGNRSLRSIQGDDEHDKNKDGFYDFTEAYNLLLSGTCGNYTDNVARFPKEFKRMDKNHDGKLSYDEING